MQCTCCGNPMNKNDLKYNADICQGCARIAAEDADREMLGDDAIYFPDGIGDK